MNVGGPARHLLTLLPRLRERGWEPVLVHGAPEPREGELLPDGAEGITAVRVPTLRRRLDPPADLRAAVALRRLIRRLRPSVIHTHMAKAGALGRVAAGRSGVPSIHTFHGHVLEGYFPGPLNHLFVSAERRLAARTDALVGVSTAVRDELLELGIGRASRWHVVPLGFDLSSLLESAVDPAEARRSLGLPPSGPTVGIVGRLAPIKDHATFLGAARRVLRRHPDATFVVAGDGESRPRLEADAARVLGRRVRFTGWVSSLPRLYAALDVVTLTSRNEGTPVALIEAAAAGRPVVATRVGGVPDVVVEGESGFLVPPGDAEGLAARICLLLEDPAVATRVGRGARERARTDFGPEPMADRIAALYAEVVAGPDPRP